MGMAVLGCALAAALPARAAAAAPTLTSASCIDRCLDDGTATAGALVRVRGHGLAGVRKVLFWGSRGAGDNRAAVPADTGRRHVDVVVPDGAASGRLAVVSATGAFSRSTRRPLTVGTPPGAGPVPVAVSSDLDAVVTKARAYYAARRHAGLRFVLRTPVAQDVRVDLVELKTGTSVAHWIDYGVAPGAPVTVRWNGRAAHAMAAGGQYEFRVEIGAQPRVAHATGAGGAPAQIASVSTPPTSAVAAGRFTFLDDIFPIRGAHSYGSAANRFGAGRVGHVHQGQDVLAACGTRLVAERGGRVIWKAWQGAAGNYVVIDNAGTDVDTVYMHLREPALVDEGQHVYTGQTIGHVGDTGDATACHLHFEMWSGPGWYSGGAPFDPLPSLEAWDRTS